MDQLDRLESKIDLINKQQHQNNITLAVNTEQLAEHMKRTSILESRIDPIENTYKESIGVIRFICFISTVATIIDVLYRLWTKT
jgi:hypothetical protein